MKVAAKGEDLWLFYFMTDYLYLQKPSKLMRYV